MRLLRHCYRAHLSTSKATTQDCSSLLTGRTATEHAQSVLQKSPKHCYRACHKAKMTQKQAIKHNSMLTNMATMMKKPCPNPKIVIEDLGGVPADFDDEAHPEDATDAKRMFHSHMRVFSDKSYVFVTKTRAFPPLVADLWRPVATRTRHRWQHIQTKTVFQSRDSTNICENMFFGCH